MCGFGGMRDFGGELTFAPHLPNGLDRLAFRLMFRDRSLHVEVKREAATYELRRGKPLQIGHHGETIKVTTDEPVSRPLPEVVPRGNPTQPPGRAPARRRPSVSRG